MNCQGFYYILPSQLELVHNASSLIEYGSNLPTVLLQKEKWLLHCSVLSPDWCQRSVGMAGLRRSCLALVRLLAAAGLLYLLASLARTALGLISAWHSGSRQQTW